MAPGYNSKPEEETTVTPMHVLDALIEALWGDVPRDKIPGDIIAAAETGDAVPLNPAAPIKTPKPQPKRKKRTFVSRLFAANEKPRTLHRARR
jgi:hypothetical protein